MSDELKLGYIGLGNRARQWPSGSSNGPVE